MNNQWSYDILIKSNRLLIVIHFEVKLLLKLLLLLILLSTVYASFITENDFLFYLIK